MQLMQQIAEILNFSLAVSPIRNHNTRKLRPRRQLGPQDGAERRMKPMFQGFATSKRFSTHTAKTAKDHRRRTGMHVSAAWTTLILIAIAMIANPLAAQISCTGSGKPCVLTGQYDNQRDAYNTHEATLICSSHPCSLSLKQTLMSSGSNPGTLLLVDPSCSTCTNDLPTITATIDGSQQSYQGTANPIYTQPLYVPGMTVSSPATTENCSPSCNMLVSATLNGTVFAWNADTGAPLWSRQGNPNGTVSNSDALWFDDCNASGYTTSAVPTAGGPLQFIGTVSTPVIDYTNVSAGYTAVMYVASFCQQTNSTSGATNDYWYLHEIDLGTGLDLCAGGSYNSSNVCGSGGTPQRVQINSSTYPVSAPCYAGAAGCNAGGTAIPFEANEQNQRPALLEVQNSSLSPNHLIYVAFGAFANSQLTPENTYHGWLLSYTTTSNGTLEPASPQGSELQFNSSNKGYTTANTDQPPCHVVTPSYDIYGNQFPLSPNTCGVLGTFWSSTRGLVATSYNDLEDSAFDIFLTSGNGPFQYQDTNGHVLSPGYNWGQSLLRMQFSDSLMGLTPYQVFTPAGQQQFSWPSSVFTQNCGPITSLSPSGYTYAPCSPAVQPSQLNSRCPKYCPSGTASNVSCPCHYTFEVENTNDQDMGTSGQMLINAGTIDRPNWLVVTTDKAGYGYLLQASDLCNGSGCTGNYSGGGANTTYSFTQGDLGNLFSFPAARVLCQNEPGNNTYPGMAENADCDRTTSMAFYNGRLYYWPNNIASGNGERLTSLQLSNWSTQTVFTGTILSWVQNLGGAGNGSNDGQTLMTGSGTSFTEQVIPGDQVVACGCTLPNCPVVTSVVNDTNVILSQHPGCTTYSGVEYSGYFINPVKDLNPPPNGTGYPGGELVIDSSSLNSTDGVIFATSSDASTTSLSCDGDTSTCPSSAAVRTPGGLFAYNATPNSSGQLGMLWNSEPYNSSSNQFGCNPGLGCSSQTFCPAPFALPTVANGRVYLGVYAINNDGTTNCPDTVPGTTSPLLYLSGVLVYAKN
jgi:hypothetical protein